MADIFLSYSSSDRLRVAPIIDALQAQGWSVWWDRELRPGPSFDREIEKALDDARCVVVVWSATAIDSEWVRAEANEGVMRDILVPVRIDDVRQPLAFRLRHVANLSGEPAHEREHEWRQFLAAVADVLAPDGEEGNPNALPAGATAPASAAAPARMPPLADQTVRNASRARRAWLAAGVLLVVMLTGAVAYRQWRPPAAALAPEASLLVLPFVLQGAGAREAYLADALTDELISSLELAGDLHVAPRTVSFYFKGRNEPAGTMANALGVRHVLRGTLGQEAGAIRIAVTLVDAATGASRWSQVFTTSTRGIRDTQEDIADAVAGALLPGRSNGPATPRPPPTASNEAYEHYLKGRALLRQRDRVDAFALALAEFGRAIALDPRFVDAHASLCDAYLTRYRRDRRQDDFAKGEAACQRALALQPPGQPSGEVHTALGALLRTSGQFTRAVAELKLADRLQPNSAEVQRQLGIALAAVGAPRAADEHLRKAIALEPTYCDARVSLGNFLFDTERFAEALRVHQQVLDVAPEYPSALIGLGAAEYMLGRHAQAEHTWQRAEQFIDPSELGSLATLQSNIGLGAYYAGDYGRAIERQRRATQLAPEDHRIWGRLAESCRAAGQHAEERTAYARAIALAERELLLNPNDWETLGLLGIYYGFTNEPAVARRYADKMLATAPTQATAHYFDALVHWARGDAAATHAALRQALRLGFSFDMLQRDPDLAEFARRNPGRFATLGPD